MAGRLANVAVTGPTLHQALSDLSVNVCIPTTHEAKAGTGGAEQGSQVVGADFLEIIL